MGIWRQRLCLFLSENDCYCRERCWKMTSNCSDLASDARGNTSSISDVPWMVFGNCSYGRSDKETLKSWQRTAYWFTFYIWAYSPLSEWVTVRYNVFFPKIKTEIVKRLANVFCKGPDINYFGLCGPDGLCCNYSTLPWWCESSHETIGKLMSMAAFQ